MQPVFDIVTLGHLLQAEVQAMIAGLSQQWLVPPLGTMEVSPEGGLQALYALERESQHFWAPLLQLLNLDAYLTSGFFPTNLAQAETVPQTAGTIERRPPPLLFFGNSEELSAGEVSSHLPTETDLTVPGRSAVRPGDLPSSGVPATTSPGQVSDIPGVGGRGHIQATGVLLASTPARPPFQSSTSSPTVPPRQEAKGNDVLPKAAGRHPAAYNDVLEAVWEKMEQSKSNSAREPYMERGFRQISWAAVKAIPIAARREQIGLGRGLRAVSMCRMGAFYTACKPARLGLVPRIYETRCPCCGQRGKGETIEHIL